MVAVRQQGYSLHKRSENQCLQGCSKCTQARALLEWPADTPLLTSTTQLSKQYMIKVFEHYGLELAQVYQLEEEPGVHWLEGLAKGPEKLLDLLH